MWGERDEHDGGEPLWGPTPEVPWVGSVSDWERLAFDHGLRATVIPQWRGVGTVLIVVSTFDRDPVSPERLAVWRQVVEEMRDVGTVLTSVSVG